MNNVIKLTRPRKEMLLDGFCEQLLDEIKSYSEMKQNVKSLSKTLAHEITGAIDAHRNSIRYIISYHENYLSPRIIDRIRKES